jgi:hypothetical protein
MPEEEKKIARYVSYEDVPKDPEIEKMVKSGFSISVYMSRQAVDAIVADTPASIKKKKGAFDFVPHVYYRQKLAQAYGYDYDWEPNVTLDWEHGLAIAWGRLTVRYRNPVTGEILSTRIAHGQDAVVLKKYGDASKGYLDIGNDMKAADSEAFKRAVMNLGFFSDLYVPEGRLTLDEAEEAEAKAREAGGSGIVVQGTSHPVKAQQETEPEPTSDEEPQHKNVAIYKCFDCHNVVTPKQLVNAAGVNISVATPAQIVSFSQSHYQKNLCYDCTQARRTVDKQQATEKEAAKSVAEAVARAEVAVAQKLAGG